MGKKHVLKWKWILAKIIHRFGRRLESLLEDDYLCWFDILLGKKRRYPDYIVLHPQRGLLFLEIKDWNLSTIQNIARVREKLLVTSSKDGFYNVRNTVLFSYRKYIHLRNSGKCLKQLICQICYSEVFF
tara:strand:- start:934 stop:1320 length:387 start_codon:yes stop_codon:yes gene_type:complete